MKYHIDANTGLEIIRLASFENDYDRDMCLDTYREEFPDVNAEYFIAVDDE